MFLLLIFCSVIFWTCRVKVVPHPVPIGIFEIVGKSWDGVITFEPGKDPKGRYFIVTPAFIMGTYWLEGEVGRLALELEKCRAEKEKD